MILKYRVTLEGIKGFFRLYFVDSKSTLYSLHKQMKSDLEFAQDQPILFKGLLGDGSVAARYALIDLGFGSVDHVRFEDTLKAGIEKFVYFYDTTSRKYVYLTFEGQEEGCVTYPRVMESKGPLPVDFENGYVAYEDIPEEQKKRNFHSCSCGDEECDGSCKDCDKDEDLDDDDLDEDDLDDGNDGSDDDREEEELVYDGSEL